MFHNKTSTYAYIDLYISGYFWCAFTWSIYLQQGSTPRIKYSVIYAVGYINILGYGRTVFVIQHYREHYILQYINIKVEGRSFLPLLAVNTLANWADGRPITLVYTAFILLTWYHAGVETREKREGEKEKSTYKRHADDDGIKRSIPAHD